MLLDGSQQAQVPLAFAHFTEGELAALDSLDPASTATDRPFVLQILPAVVAEMVELYQPLNGPYRRAQSRQRRIVHLLEHQIKVWPVDAVVSENNVTQRHGYAISTGGGTYVLRTRPLGSVLLFKSHGCASGGRPKSFS